MVILAGLTPGQHEVLTTSIGVFGLGYFIGIGFVVVIGLVMRGR